MSVPLSTQLASDFQSVVTCTRITLAEQGFGVLTEVDIKGDTEGQARLTAKLGAAISSLTSKRR